MKQFIIVIRTDLFPKAIPCYFCVYSPPTEPKLLNLQNKKVETVNVSKQHADTKVILIYGPSKS